MKERIIKNWITSILGLIVAMAGIVLFILGRIGVLEMIPALLVGLAFFSSKDSRIRNIYKYIFRSSDNNYFDQTYSHRWEDDE